MLLNQETLRLIFGLKLRGLRLDRGLSLKDLATKTGLSASYLNEIEKGKKYPKPEKISLLTEILGESYDDLISLKLKRELSLVSQLLEKGVFNQMPFELFGIPANMIFELLAEKPKKVRVLIGTCLELARAHNIQVEDFLYATLRAYLDMHQNFFPGLEEKATEIRKQQKLNVLLPPSEVYKALKAALKSQYKIEVVEKNLDKSDLDLVTYLWLDSKSVLIVDEQIELREKIYLLARQMAYQFLKVKDPPRHSQHRSFESFDQLFKHFSANYLAGALLVPQEELRQDLKDIFGAAEWSNDNLLSLLKKYPATAESLFHRFSQLLPRHFGLENLFFLRYDFDQRRNRFEVSRELHLSNLHSPHAMKSDEHYCARWVTHKMAKNLMDKPSDWQIGAQRSRFHNTENEYLVFTCGFSKSKRVNDFGSVSLGITINEKSQRILNFLKDSTIPKLVVSETCERCPIESCQERLAPLASHLNPLRIEHLNSAIQRLEKEL